eukprot:scaffold31477_cov36-Cyclotella_meneghiniana.AAC.1
MTDIQFANLESTHNEIIGKCKFNETDFISPSHLDDNPAVESNRRHSDTNTRNNNSSDPMPNRLPERNFDTILEIFRAAAGGFTTYCCDFLNSCQDNSMNSSEEVTIAGVARDLARTHNRCLDKKQYITYEIICCSFLLAQLDETGNQDSILKQYIRDAINEQHGVT